MSFFVENLGVRGPAHAVPFFFLTLSLVADRDIYVGMTEEPLQKVS